MANLRALEQPASHGAVVTYPGLVVVDGNGNLAVNVYGNIIPARWADPLVVAVGDPVTVSIAAGQSLGDAVVTARTAMAPRPATGTVKAPIVAGPVITITGTDGTDYTATFLTSYTPTVGDNVSLAWKNGSPEVSGKVGAVAAPGSNTAPVPAPPGPSQSGQTPYAATDSATYVPGLGLWDKWSLQGGRLYQGSSGGYATYGAWFYAGSPAQLAGRTITRIQFTLGARDPNAGGYSSPVPVHFYTHSSTNRPGGDVTRVTGPFDVIIQPGAGQATFDLPTSFAADLLNGGGISIAGDPYTGFAGVRQDAMSGLLLFDWSR